MKVSTNKRDAHAVQLAAVTLSLLGLVAISALLIDACTTARVGVPLSEPVRLGPIEEQGQVVFMRYCNQCHPNGSAGLGPAINNKPLPGAVIRAQVRQGFGAMPPFGEDEISDQELSTLVEYLVALRQAYFAQGEEREAADSVRSSAR